MRAGGRCQSELRGHLWWYSFRQYAPRALASLRFVKQPSRNELFKVAINAQNEWF